MPATILQHRLFDGDAATSWTDLSATASEWNGSNHSRQSVHSSTNTTKSPQSEESTAKTSTSPPPRPSIVVPNPDPDHPRKSVVAYWDGQGYVVSLETTETETDGAVLPSFVPSDTSSEDYTTDDDEDFASDAESFCGDDPEHTPEENSSDSSSSTDEETTKYEYGDARPSLSSNNNQDGTHHQPATAKTNPFATLPASSMCAPSPYYRRASVQRRNSTSTTSLRHTVHGSGRNWTNNNYYNGHGSTGTRYRTEGHNHRSAERSHHNSNTNTVHRPHQPPSFPPRSHHRYHPNNNFQRRAPRRRSNEDYYSQYAASSSQQRRSSMGPCAAVPTPALAVARDDGAPPTATGPPPGFVSLVVKPDAEEEEVVRDPWDCLDLQMLQALDHEGGSSGPAEQPRRPTPPATAAVGTAAASLDSNTDTTTNDACLLRGLNWEMEPSYLYEVAKLSQLDSTVLEHQLDDFLFGRHRRASM